ncbi:MAG TPA: hypothetical protein VGM14_17405 [Streptosporangiaceae bacterium]
MTTGARIPTAQQVGELRWIDDELARVDRARTWLISRRMILLAELSRPSTAPVTSIAPVGDRAAPLGLEPTRPELTGRTVAQILLVSGAVLVVIAAAVFTVANWSSIGAAGRCAVLLGVTAIVLAAPKLLTRRELTATAETIAGIGLALTLADAYLVEHLLKSPGHGLRTAAGSAVIAGIWIAYGRATKLRLPAVAGIAMAQLPALLATADLASRSPIGPLSVVLVLTAGADLLLTRELSRRDLRPEALASSILAVATGTIGVCLVLPVALQALAGTGTRTASPAWSAVVTLGLAALACMAVSNDRPWLKAVAIGLAAPAAGSLPAAIGATGWARTGLLDLAIAALAGLAAAAATRPTGPISQTGPIVTATLGAIALALSATATATATAASVPECAILALIFGLAAAFARNPHAAVISTGAALAALTGLAFAAQAAAGVPLDQRGFAVLGVATLAIIGSTLLRRTRPAHSHVLDLGAGVIVVIAAVVAAGRADSFATVATAAAILASSTAWVRGGARRTIALASAGLATIAAIGVQWQPLATAWFETDSARAWGGQPLVGAAGPGLPFATVVFALCLAALASTFGAWQGERRASLDALAIALPLVVVPGALAGGLGYSITYAGLLALALGLTSWAAIDGRLVPVSAAAVATVLALALALATPTATLIALGCLTGCYLALAYKTPARIATAALSVLAAAALAGATALAAGGPAWAAGISALGIAATAHLLAAKLTARLPLTAIAVECAAWTAAAAGTALCLSHPATASLAFSIIGLQCLGTAARTDRRPALWIGLIALETAWCLLLLTLGVETIEAYTIPAAAIAIAFARRSQAATRSSWAASPGLALLLLPSLITVWHTHGWIRPTLLGLAAAAVALAGARLKLQAPLLIGAAVAALDAVDQLAPDVRRLAESLPGWVPIAIIGATLIWVGATYEARLRDLVKLRQSLASLH